MRPSENASKVRTTRRQARSERRFTVTNREIMADLMYGRDDRASAPDRGDR